MFFSFRRGALAALAVPFLCASAFAHGFTLGDLQIDHPWARETPVGATTGAGYLTIRNTGAEPDRLVAVATPAAATAEIHEGYTQDGVAKMRKLERGIEIPAGGETKLAPGGTHLMLMGLKEGLAEGMRVPATLTFEKAGKIEVELEVENMAYGRSGAARKDQGHGHH